MRKSKNEVVTRLVEETVEESIACNKCGNSIIANLRDGEGNFNQDLYHNISLHFGYGSNHDMEHWSFDLCEDCLVELAKTFKHVPSGFYLDTSYLIVEDESEEHQKLFDHWKKTGEWEELKYKTYDELVDLANIFNLEYINKFIKKNYPDKPLIGEEC